MLPLIQRLKSFFQGKTLTQHQAEKIVSSLEIFKKIIDSPATNFLVNLTKSNIDNQILDALKRGIGPVIMAIHSVECSSIADPNQKLECFLKMASQLEKPRRSRLLRKLGGSMFQEISEDYYSDSVAEEIIEEEYLKNKS